MNTLLSFGIHHAWKRASVRLLALQPGERVLDVCGGTGTWRSWRPDRSEAAAE